MVLADDATLGLDATVQVQVLDLLLQRCRARACAVILITHDLGIVAQYCDPRRRHAGGPAWSRSADVAGFMRGPADPYSTSLLAAARVRPTPADMTSVRRDAGLRALLEVKDLRKIFPATGERGEVRAVDGIDLSITRGQTLAAGGRKRFRQDDGRSVPVAIDQGHVRDKSCSTAPTSRRPRHWQFRSFRRRMQMVFQEPYVALNPRAGAWRTLIGEPFGLLDPMSSAERAKRVARLLELVHLPPGLARVYPHELTAGEQKRVGIARALATDPEFVVFDEPTTALDVRVRAQIIDLIRELQTRVGMTALFITHDLNSGALARASCGGDVSRPYHRKRGDRGDLCQPGP